MYIHIHIHIMYRKIDDYFRKSGFSRPNKKRHARNYDSSTRPGKDLLANHHTPLFHTICVCIIHIILVLVKLKAWFENYWDMNCLNWWYFVVRTHVCIYMIIYIYMYVCMYVCMYIYIYISTINHSYWSYKPT